MDFFGYIKKERERILGQTVEQIIEKDRDKYPKALAHVYEVMVAQRIRNGNIFARYGKQKDGTYRVTVNAGDINLDYENPFCPYDRGGSQIISIGDTLVDHIFNKLTGIGVSDLWGEGSKSVLEQLFLWSCFDLRMLDKAEQVMLKAYERNLPEIKQIFEGARIGLKPQVEAQKENIMRWVEQLQEYDSTKEEKVGSLRIDIHGWDRLEQNLVYVDYFLEKLKEPAKK